MVSLVGYTGFVGSNIYSSGNFDEVYDSKNILEAYGTNPDLLIYSGLPAEKYLANNNPKKDMELILGAEKNISLINKKGVISPFFIMQVHPVQNLKLHKAFPCQYLQ